MTDAHFAILLTALLLTKHFIVDFPLQPRWMYANKGTFGHPGGIAHAVLHGAVTLAILVMSGIDRDIALFLVTWEVALHYLIDWAKMTLNKRMGWAPNTAEAFWWLLGLDQWLHHACYVAIVIVVVR